MNLETIFTIIFAILTTVGVFVSFYFYAKSKVYAATEKAVNDAEQEDKTAEEKMELAVNQIYSIVPVAVKPFITKQVIQGIVQKAFDKIEEYAEKQVAKEKAKKEVTDGESVKEGD